MRTYFSLILVVMLSLNAAYAASMGICDALEHTSSSAAHFGHHGHGHDDDHAHDAQQMSADETGKSSSSGDHQHHHVHPGFSTLLPGAIGITPPPSGSTLATIPVETFASALPALPERPPRTTLA